MVNPIVKLVWALVVIVACVLLLSVLGPLIVVGGFLALLLKLAK